MKGKISPKLREILDNSRDPHAEIERRRINAASPERVLGEERTNDDLLNAYDKAVVEYDEATKRAYWLKPFSYLTVREKRIAYEDARQQIIRRLIPRVR